MGRKSRKRAVLEALKSLGKPDITLDHKAKICSYLIGLLGRELVYRDTDFVRGELVPALREASDWLRPDRSPKATYLRGSLMALYVLAEPYAIESELAVQLELDE